jgi:2-dehydro-3-deoxygalactonokinase
MIGIDWGTSSFRAYRIANGQVVDSIANGHVVDCLERPAGILHVPPGGFPATLHEAIAPWLEAGESRVLMSGMVGSRQGWIEAPYCPCPANAAAIARSLQPVPFDAAEVFIVPGLCATDAAGTPEVMRGEETQIFGAQAEGLVCLPGSHAKWARVTSGSITGFETYLSGEAFAALRAATILGRMMTDAPHSDAAFAEGLDRAASPGHLLHHLFGVRSRGLFGTLPDTDSASYLSGLLIGTEIRAAMPAPTHVTLLGTPTLCARYATAITRFGGTATIGPSDCAAAGLALIGTLTPWR